MRGGARPGAGRKRKTLAELVRDGTFYARKAKHRQLLRIDGTLSQAADADPTLLRLVQTQLAYREQADRNPGWAQALAHRFEREARELLVVSEASRPRSVRRGVGRPVSGRGRTVSSLLGGSLDGEPSGRVEQQFEAVVGVRGNLGRGMGYSLGLRPADLDGFV